MLKSLLFKFVSLNPCLGWQHIYFWKWQQILSKVAVYSLMIISEHLHEGYSIYFYYLVILLSGFNTRIMLTSEKPQGSVSPCFLWRSLSRTGINSVITRFDWHGIWTKLWNFHKIRMFSFMASLYVKSILFRPPIPSSRCLCRFCLSRNLSA